MSCVKLSRIYDVELLDNGLAEARLIGQGGEVLVTQSLDGTDATLTFEIPGDAKGWVALEVDDADGDTAWTNPLWLERRSKADYLGHDGTNEGGADEEDA